ncbi:alpha/beta fold hydrolase [Abyssibius alkaniclasticus]|uniref:alpha/beta fold hydrolase n=1 Tax=Abyssibius alkaniclasticus TaxID=2881234 RepID=UPI004058883A
MIAQHRIGAPQPLAQHVAQMLAAYQGAMAASAALGTESFPWHPLLDPSGLEPCDPVVLAQEVGARMATTLAGLARWQNHPYRRAPETAPPVWQSGATRLLDYAPDALHTAVAVLVLPSLVNRAYIMDLTPETSAMGRLAAAGLHPYLLDWGALGPDEAGFGIQHYVARARAALAHIGPACLLGYCMGGTVAAGLAARSSENIRGLVTLGAPWDFTAGGGVRSQLRLLYGQHDGAAARALLGGLAETYGCIPAALFQSLFAALTPLAFATKFRRFAELPANSPAETCFVALEDWLADGIAMSAPAAQELLLDWHLGNAPQLGNWQLEGGPVRAQNLTCPTLVVAGSHDTIAPAAGALALARAAPKATAFTAPTGHVGLITSARAAPVLWQRVCSFVQSL